MLLDKFIKTTSRFFGTNTEDIIKGGVWVGSAKIVGVIVAFLLSIVYARYLTKETFGAFQFVLSIIGIAGIFSLSEFGPAMVRSVARGFKGDFPKVAKIQVISSVAIGLISFGTAFYFFLNGQIHFFYAFIVAGFMAPLTYGTESFLRYWIAERKIKERNIYGAAKSIITFVFVGATALFISKFYLPIHLALPMVAGAYFLSIALPKTILFIKTLREVPKEDRAKTDPDTIKYGTRLTLIEIPNTIANNLDSLLVFSLLGAENLALYTFAVAPVEHIRGLAITTLSQVGAPKFATQKAENLKKHLPKKVMKAMLVLALMATAYVVLAPFLFDIVFPRYSSSVIFSQVFALTILLVPSQVFASALTATGSKKQITIYKIVSPIIRLGMVAVLVPLFGIWGAVVARVTGRFIRLLLSWFLVATVSENQTAI